ncbi:MAG: PAN domain-containing protein [Hyphomicrobiales bacterium]
MLLRRLSVLAIAGILSLPAAISAAQTFERGVDRPGADYTSFDLRGGPRACQAACGRDGQCAAWTYVRAGFQGPLPRCWLKGSVPPATGNGCCVSGIMR